MNLYRELVYDDAVRKSAIRVDQIKTRIMNDVTKNQLQKKYQIRSLVEYEQLVEFCESLGMTLSWMYDPKVMTNKVTNIIAPNSLCCRECDGPPIFVHKKVKVKYCYLTQQRQLKSARNI